MKLVVIESPYAGNIDRNILYARLCMKDSLGRGEAPIASHLLYTQPHILDDDRPEERMLGIEAGLAWGRNAELVAVYEDFGTSNGMLLGMQRADRSGIGVEKRKLHLETFAQHFSTNVSEG